MKNATRVILLICLVACGLSCDETIEIQPPVHDAPKSLSQGFDTFWVRMRERYVYWDCEQTNWNGIYVRYAPLFERLNINDGKDRQVAISYYEEVTKSLGDGHFFMKFDVNTFPESRSLNPVATQKLSAPAYRPPYTYTSFVKSRLDPGYIEANALTMDDRPFFVLAGTIDNSILYLSGSSCDFRSAYDRNSTPELRYALDFFFERLNDDSITGVIIDLRNNPGGELADLNFLIGSMIDKPLVYGEVRYKIGKGISDFTPWLNTVIHPRTDSKLIMVPVIGLIDNFTTSAAELAAAGISALPTGVLVGEDTYGATSIVTPGEFYNSGSFLIGNQMDVMMSSATFRYAGEDACNQRLLRPDVRVPFAVDQLLEGIDPVLNAAISLAR